jgi:L-ascorbate metabolism protein UlaG (beta-lactamase superfamily)
MGVLSCRFDKGEENAMKLTWYGHAAFRVEAGGATILIDPFLAGNPSWGKGWEGPAEGVTHVLLTHGHNDHFGNAIDILKATGAMLVANAEISDYVAGKGIEKVNPGNHGGTVDCGGFTTTFVNAVHSSALTLGDGANVYLGNPLGLVLHFGDGQSLYHMGDTDIFSDMALINELHQPAVGIVPIGDRFTMGGAVAALACRRFFNFKTAIPCHYATFGALDQTADKFTAGMEGSSTQVVVPTVGEPFDV